MKQFSQLVLALEDATDSKQRAVILVRYLTSAPDEDAAWAIKLLTDKPIKRMVDSAMLRKAGLVASGLPLWIFEESLKAVGDECEAVALILPEPDEESSLTLSRCIHTQVNSLAGLDSNRQVELLVKYWSGMKRDGRLVFNRIVSGKLRTPVSTGAVSSAIALIGEIPVSTVNLRLASNWNPDASFYRNLISSDQSDAVDGRPYRFCCTSPANSDLSFLAEGAKWAAEWKLDGVRAQVVRRRGSCFIWLKSEVLATSHFPEIATSCVAVPDGTVLDGEIVAILDGSFFSASAISKRLDRKPRSATPAGEPAMVFLAFDILECAGHDVRHLTFGERRSLLEQVLADRPLIGLRPATDTIGVRAQGGLAVSEVLPLSSRETVVPLLDLARQHGLSGLIVKGSASSYKSPGEQDAWFALKAEPHSVLAVLMYVERPSGEYGSSFQFTLGVWKDDELVPIAKLGGQFSGEESSLIDGFVKENTVEKFGPVRTVRPGIVMELRFDAIEVSARRKSGIILRSPRIYRMCIGMRPDEAGQLSMLTQLL